MRWHWSQENLQMLLIRLDRRGRDFARRIFSGKLLSFTLAAGIFGFIGVIAWRGRNFPEPPGTGQNVNSKRTVLHAISKTNSPGPSANRMVTADQVRANGLSLKFYQEAWIATSGSKTDENSKFFNHLGFVTAMAIKGYSSEAISLICETYGPGKLRCQLIETVFQCCSDLDASGSLYNLLEYDDEKDSACEGIGWQLAVSAAPDTADLGQFSFLGDRLDSMLAAFAKRYVSQHLNGTSEEISGAFCDAFNLPLSKQAARRTLLELYQISPFDGWGTLIGRDIVLSGAERQQILELMVAKDPAKAVEKIGETKDGEADFTAAFKHWLAIDAAKPIEWFQNNAPNLTAAQKDRSIQGIAEFSASHGNCSVAWLWVEQITNPEIHKAAEGQVWSIERDIIRREVSRDPGIAIQAMISGKSSHQDYWIEEAIGTWVMKEPKEAQDWYLKNWNSLPSDKSQYVAAAFANQAINQGDPAKAREWAAHIQDPKTKQRIEAGIAKAEGNKGK